MKTLKSLLYVFLAAFLFVGCNDDENFNPGEPEDLDCYSVYFPTQENIGSRNSTPRLLTEMSFTRTPPEERGCDRSSRGRNVE